jgi:hypothetical protein
MTTSNDAAFLTRVPLRLRMVDDPVPGGLHARWWPQSRDLGVELADLVDHFPAAEGGVMRAIFSRPDWDTPLRRVSLKRGVMKAGSFPRDDTHVMLLTMFDRSTLKILVVPPGLSAAAGQAALRTGSPEDFASTVDPSGAGVAVPQDPADERGAVGVRHGPEGPEGVG